MSQVVNGNDGVQSLPNVSATFARPGDYVLALRIASAPDRKHAADADVLRDLLRMTPGDDLRSVRDRALLAFGMAGAFRRSELVALRMDDVLVVPEGLRVLVRRSKTVSVVPRPLPLVRLRLGSSSRA